MAPIIIVCCLCFISCTTLVAFMGEVIAKAVPRVGDDKATKAIFKHLIEQGEQGEQGCNRRESREQYEEGPQRVTARCGSPECSN